MIGGHGWLLPVLEGNLGAHEFGEVGRAGSLRHHPAEADGIELDALACAADRRGAAAGPVRYRVKSLPQAVP